MATLLTGGTGLLGANLTRVLNARGIRPRLLVRERSSRVGLQGTEYEAVVGDILDARSVERAMRGVDQVFHLAGRVRKNPASAHLLRQVHVEGEHPYHQTKREGERLAQKAAAEGLEVVIANPSFLVGAYDAGPSSGELLVWVARGRVPFYPSGGNNFVGAQDVALGLLLLMERGLSGQRYILGGENLTFRQFLTQCAEQAGVAPPRFPAPERLLRRAGTIGDWVGHLAPDRMRNLSSSMVETMFLPAYYSSHKAMSQLGYRPRPIRFAIRDAYRWFQEVGMIPRDQPLAASAEA